MIAQRKVKIAISLIIIVILFGTAGFVLIERWSVLDALYMTIITLSTVGFEEIQPLDPAGRIFTLFLIISGLGVFVFGLTAVSSFILEGQLGGLVRRRRMERKIKGMSNHFIVCGMGVTGERVIEEFRREHVPFVVIEKEKDKIARLETLPEVICIEGDATSDEVLKQAGIERAKGLVSALSLDTDNLFVVISARHLNADLRIVARAADEAAQYKMKSAGADNVISPNTIGGIRMASILLRPAVVSFLDVMSSGEADMSLRLEEVTVPAGSHLDKKSLKEAQIPQETGLMIIAIRKKGESSFMYNPTSSTSFSVGDTLIVLGRLNQVDRLHSYIEK